MSADEDFTAAEAPEGRGSWAEACAIWERLVAVAREPRLLLRYGACLQHAGRLREAERVWQEAALHLASASDAYIHLGLLAIKENRLSDAEAALEQALRLGDLTGLAVRCRTSRARGPVRRNGRRHRAYREHGSAGSGRKACPRFDGGRSGANGD